MAQISLMDDELKTKFLTAKMRLTLLVVLLGVNFYYFSYYNPLLALAIAGFVY